MYEVTQFYSLLCIYGTLDSPDDIAQLPLVPQAGTRLKDAQTGNGRRCAIP